MGLTTQLLEWFRFDETSDGSIPVSRVGEVAGLAFTDNNTTLSSVGLLGDVADFERDNHEYLSLVDEAIFDRGDTDWTIVLWVKFESSSATFQYAVISKDSSPSSRQWRLDWDNATNRLRWFVFQADGSVAGTVSANNLGNPSSGQWYFIVVWHSATSNQVGIQINNGTADTSGTTAAAGSGTAPTLIGAFEIGGTPRYMDGLIGPLGIWSRLLDADEKNALYNGGAGFDYPFTSTTPNMALLQSGTMTGNCQQLCGGMAG